MSLGFEWNARKAQTNLQKHGVDFVEAASVFSDPIARIFLDEGHSTGELREIIIGHSSRKSSCWCASLSLRKSGFELSARETPHGESSAIMKTTLSTKTKAQQPDELAPEYRFDYRKAKPNRFAKRTQPESMVVLLDPDVAEVFKTGDTVNAVLRALMTTMPPRRGSSHR